MNKKTKVNLLFVDNDPDFSDEVVSDLTAMGFVVTALTTQAAAEDYLAERRPELALINLTLEYMDSGFVLAYHIKKKYRDVPVILLSSVASETGIDFDTITREERSWIKADVLLDKPVRMEQLHRELHRLLPAGMYPSGIGSHSH